ncbi:MAG: hypothetical protein SGPRY_006257 [Prymnesium sp.]
MGDSREARAFAISVREEASVHPEEGRGYERELTRLWGGPPPRWYPAALSSFPRASGVALVTGGASGIGFFAAKLLAAVGMVVLIPARPHLPHEAAGAVAAIRASLPNADVRVPSVPLDLGSLASVREFCAHLRAEEGQLDVLGLNAGRGGSENNALELSEDGFEATMQVNFLSHALMVRELLPLLRRSDFARVVAHTSSARHNSRASELGELSNTRRGTSPWSQYSLSKAQLFTSLPPPTFLLQLPRRTLPLTSHPTRCDDALAGSTLHVLQSPQLAAGGDGSHGSSECGGPRSRGDRLEHSA